MIELTTQEFLAINGAIGAGLPFLVSTLKRASWPKWLKKSLALIVSGAAAVISTGVAQGWTSLDWATVLGAAAVIVPSAQATYLGFLKESRLDAVIESLPRRVRAKPVSESETVGVVRPIKGRHEK